MYDNKNKKSIANLFLRQPVYVLLNISDNDYLYNVAKKSELSFRGAIYFIGKVFNHLGIIKTSKRGRLQLVTLTKDGRELKESFKVFVDKLKKLDEKNG